MMWYTILQLVYLITIWLVFNINTALLMLAAGVVGFILLETVNYIEHYGLLRSKNDQGRYEAVRAIHSWNSNHIIGRIVLYELTRHSDHHYMASKNTKAWCVGKRRLKCPLVTLPQWSFPCFRLFGLN